MHDVVPLPKTLRFLRRISFPRKLGILERIFGFQLKKHGVCWVECSNGTVWKLDLSDSCHRWMVYGYYEGDTLIPWALNQLKKGGVFVDSGANIGQWLLYIGGMPDVKSIAVEPVESERIWLAECIENQKQWNVTIFDCGFGRIAETVEIQCDGPRSTTNTDWYKSQGFKKSFINLRPLDHLLAENSMHHVRLWKLDVEGGELDALKGAESFLLEKRIDSIVFECHPDSFTAISEFLGNVGYQIYTVDRSGPVKFLENELMSTAYLLALPGS